MRIASILKGISIFFLTLGLGASAAPILQVENGILTGATNIDIGGKKYDVSFIDGTCAALFNGCTGAIGPFTTYGALNAADHALLDQVFVDGPLGLFDSHPELTRGCALTTECSVLTPQVYWNPGAMIYAFAANFSPNDPYNRDDYIGSTPFNPSYDLSTIPYYTFAIFSEAKSGVVPEPSSQWIFGLGLALLAGRSFRTRRCMKAVAEPNRIRCVLSR